MTTNYTVGGEVESWCTKCKLELGHTIVAIVDNLPKRVECNTCHGKHNYRKKPALRSGSNPKGPSRKRKTPEDIYNEHIALVTSGDLSNAKKYSMSGNFEKDQIIDHPKFGTGIVMSILQVNKIEILFKDGPKLLTQNK